LPEAPAGSEIRRDQTAIGSTGFGQIRFDKKYHQNHIRFDNINNTIIANERQFVNIVEK
jgi:hypothetical protein